MPFMYTCWVSFCVKLWELVLILCKSMGERVGPLDPYCSKWGLWTGSIGIFIWDGIRNADSQAQPHLFRICTLKIPRWVVHTLQCESTSQSFYRQTEDKSWHTQWLFPLLFLWQASLVKPSAFPQWTLSDFIMHLNTVFWVCSPHQKRKDQWPKFLKNSKETLCAKVQKGGSLSLQTDLSLVKRYIFFLFYFNSRQAQDQVIY